MFCSEWKVCFSVSPDSVPVHQPEPSVRDDPLHPQRLLRLHAAGGHAPKRHRLLVWYPQSDWHGEFCFSSDKNKRLFRTIRGSLNDLLRLLHCAPCRLKPAWWWTSSGSAASVWPSTAGVASCSAWTLSLHGPTPPHRCRNNNLLPHLHLQASSLKSTLRFWVEFVFVFCCFWATRNIHLMFGPPHYWCRECFTVFLSDSGATKGSVDCCSLRSTANSLTECCLVLFWFTVSSNWTPHRGFFDCLRVISLTQQCHRYC